MDWLRKERVEQTEEEKQEMEDQFIKHLGEVYWTDETARARRMNFLSLEATEERPLATWREMVACLFYTSDAADE